MIYNLSGVIDKINKNSIIITFVDKKRDRKTIEILKENVLDRDNKVIRRLKKGDSISLRFLNEDNFHFEKQEPIIISIDDIKQAMREVEEELDFDFDKEGVM